jgi:hypothetical protein
LLINLKVNNKGDFTVSEQNKEMQKAVDSVVEQLIGQEQKSETVEKAMPTSLPANGGKDEIRSGTPLMEQKELEAKKDKAKKSEEETEESKEDKVEKAEDCKYDDKMKKDDKKDKDDKKKMKKSLAELAEVLDEEELELIKAWREEASAETITKSETAQEEKETEQEDITKSLAKVVEEQIAPLKKALDEKDALIKGMSEKIEKMASQPAYERRSISNLETLEKSGASNAQELSKSQVAERMLEMQLAGKGVTSRHIAEFEATGNISDPNVRAIVFKELKLN